MDFGSYPPEINSGRMYAGPGVAPMLTASEAWQGLAAELHSAAASYQSVVSGLTAGPWVGPSSSTMAAAAASYVTWLNATAAQVEETAAQAKSAAAATSSGAAMRNDIRTSHLRFAARPRNVSARPAQRQRIRRMPCKPGPRGWWPVRRA